MVALPNRHSFPELLWSLWAATPWPLTYCPALWNWPRKFPPQRLGEGHRAFSFFFHGNSNTPGFLPFLYTASLLGMFLPRLILLPMSLQKPLWLWANIKAGVMFAFGIYCQAPRRPWGLSRASTAHSQRGSMQTFHVTSRRTRPSEGWHVAQGCTDRQ